MPLEATWMNLEIIKLSEVSQRKINIIWYDLYMEYLKNDTNELIYKIEIDSQSYRMNLWLLRGGEGRRDRWEVWDWHVHTTIFKRDTQQGPTV